MSQQLDQTRIVIRERSYSELLDLALLVVRTYAWPYVAVLAVGAVPMMLVNFWVLADLLEPDLEPGSVVQYLMLMVLLVFLEVPLATAPATLYLGQAVFAERPDLRAVGRDFLGSVGQLLLFQVLLRPLAVIWPHLNEVILLDRNPLWAKGSGTSTWRRARRFHRDDAGELLARAMIGAAAAFALFLSLWLGVYLLRRLLLNQRTFDYSMYALYFPMAWWLVVGYFTVVRFLNYLDMRIRREGWEVELAMRAEQARLMRQWK